MTTNNHILSTLFLVLSNATIFFISHIHFHCSSGRFFSCHFAVFLLTFSFFLSVFSFNAHVFQIIVIFSISFGGLVGSIFSLGRAESFFDFSSHSPFFILPFFHCLFVTLRSRSLSCAFCFSTRAAPALQDKASCAASQQSHPLGMQSMPGANLQVWRVGLWPWPAQEIRALCQTPRTPRRRAWSARSASLPVVSLRRATCRGAPSTLAQRGCGHCV